MQLLFLLFVMIIVLISENKPETNGIYKINYKEWIFGLFPLFLLFLVLSFFEITENYLKSDVLQYFLFLMTVILFIFIIGISRTYIEFFEDKIVYRKFFGSKKELFYNEITFFREHFFTYNTENYSKREHIIMKILKDDKIVLDISKKHDEVEKILQYKRVSYANVNFAKEEIKRAIFLVLNCFLIAAFFTILMNLISY